jgi:hypothetical protein
MAPSKIERVARMRVLAAEFRGFAAQTLQDDYKKLLLQAAVEIDREASRIEGFTLSAVTDLAS